MIAKKIIFAVLISIFFISLASATSINIDMKDSFGVGEEISFDYTITSKNSETINYIPSVSCPNAPVPLLKRKNATLIANIPLQENYVFMSSLNENIEPQICWVSVEIYSPIIISERKSFEIKTFSSFNFNISICEEISCNVEKSLFIKNQTIYIGYDSDISNLSIITNLIYPDGQKAQLVFPLQIKAEQIGTYWLDIIASKSGYKTINKKIPFTVIEKGIEIENLNLNAIKEQDKTFKITFWIFYSILILGIIGIGIILFIVIRKRKMVKG